MSASLLKKSLSIVEENLSTNKKKTASRVADSAMAIMPENQKLLKYIGKKGNKRKQQEILTKKKLTVVEAKRLLTSTKRSAEDNVKKLLLLSSGKLNLDTSEKLMRRARTGHYIIPEPKPQEEEKSVFTEADFRAFEADLFCSS